ncbi:interferon regulatory factor 1b [Anoplopoma fimbria]|uniref:interferon regulatory factor 1b n=1 Tax=Anoplopoma fimbria TaxID=229290 RepID=UPI0023ECA73F|nr:interferon regulatory factor 1b [Anoplopoma fimbria]
MWSSVLLKENLSNMPVSRMRMRPWIEKQIESNSVSGLSWVDKDKTMFSIPWKHAARHGWEMDKDATLFKQWAIHTGKHVEGQACDPKTWKANFRCAMNSLPDIEEVKDKSVNKGHQAMRVFRMLPTSPKSRDKRSKGKESKPRRKNSMIKMEEEGEYMDTSSHEPMQEGASSTQENTVDSTVQTEHTDFSFVSPSEVPEWSLSVEIGSDFNQRFEVSPDHSPDYDYSDDIVQICQQLEKDSHWVMGGFEGTGFLSNEACTSPGSQWSESSSVDELDDMPQYTVLGSDTQNSTDDIWKSFFHQAF